MSLTISFMESLLVITNTFGFIAIIAIVVGIVFSKKQQTSEGLIKAIQFATWKHRDQKRKSIGDIPYIIHPIRVCQILIENGCGYNLPLLQAALLHDTVEDTDTTLDEIDDIFGVIVKRLIEEVSDNKSLPKEQRKRLQILNAEDKSHDAKLLSIADKIANLEDLSSGPRGIPIGWTIKRVQDYFMWAKRVHKGLRGQNKRLDKCFNAIIKGQFEYFDGNNYPKIDE